MIRHRLEFMSTAISPVSAAGKESLALNRRRIIIDEALERLQGYAFISNEFEAARLEQWADDQQEHLVHHHDRERYGEVSKLANLMTEARKGAAHLRTESLKTEYGNRA